MRSKKRKLRNFYFGNILAYSGRGRKGGDEKSLPRGKLFHHFRFTIYDFRLNLGIGGIWRLIYCDRGG